METQRSCSLTACVSSASPRPWNYTCNTYDPTHTSSHVRLCHDTASTDLPDTPLSGAAQAQGPYAPNAFPPPWHYTTNTYAPLNTSSDVHQHCSPRDHRYIYPHPDWRCHTSPTGGRDRAPGSLVADRDQAPVSVSVGSGSSDSGSTAPMAGSYFRDYCFQDCCSQGGIAGGGVARCRIAGIRVAGGGIARIGILRRRVAGGSIARCRVRGGRCLRRRIG